MNRLLLPTFLFAAGALAADLRTGFLVQDLNFAGPGEWRMSTDPIWVKRYPLLRMRYRATGLAARDSALLTLRPGSVGPVTPGATNPENPFAMGNPVVAVTAGQLHSDGRSHTLETDISGKILTEQMDQLIFALPAGAGLVVEELEFRSRDDVMPCDGSAGVPLPEGSSKVAASSPLACGPWPATSLRGRESIRVDAAGRKGAALYLSMAGHFEGLLKTAAGSSEPSHVVARVRYQGGDPAGEEQFPLLVSERRHLILDRQPALYVLALDPKRRLAGVELLDRSPHAQLVVYAAGLSSRRPPEATGEPLPPPARPGRKPSGEVDLSASKWYRLQAASGKTLPQEDLRAELQEAREAGGRRLSLSLTNTGRQTLEFTLVFPALEVRPSADPGDVYYLFPRQGAIVSRAEQSLEAVYSGVFPLQFLDVFAPSANRGAALILQDTTGQIKTFRLAKSGASARMEVDHAVRLEPGATYRAPEASIVLHGGDWRQGFEAYRAWASSWYTPAGPRPAWLRTAFWCRRDYPVGGSGRLFDVRAGRYTFDEILRDGAAFGGIDFIDISGWALSERVGRVGDYPIELGGMQDLRRNIDLAMRSGVPTGLYFEGYLIDKNSEVGRRFGEKWQLIGADGRGMWWPGGSPELFVCPYLPEWHRYLAGRMAEVAAGTGARGVYIDEHGFGTRRCYSRDHGHAPGTGSIPGEIQMVKETRRALDAAGARDTMIYLEETPVDAAAPYYDAAFCYSLPHSNIQTSPAKLNLWRFVFPDVRLWDMLTIGIHPRVLSPEDFRLSLWHGNGLWLKGHSETWYGDDLLAFIRRSRELLKRHAAAFNGAADPLVASPHPAVLINRFRGGGETVHTLFNSSYRTVRFQFGGRRLALGPRQVDVVPERL